MYDPTRQLLHIHIPKTAGTSLKDVVFGPDTPTRHERAADFPVPVWESARSFTCVRNPFDRIVSAYLYHVGPKYRGFLVRKDPHLKERTFGDYLERYVAVASPDPVFASQVDYVDHPVSPKPIDVILRFETLAEDYAVLRDQLGLTGELPHRLRLERDGYRAYYGSAERTLVEATFARDLDRFDYGY